MIGIALLGAGRMGRVHAQAVRNAGARVVSIFDPVTDAAKALAHDVGATAVGSAEAAMEHDDASAILIATASDTHVDLLIQAVGYGKPVMCEKPLAPTLGEARRCIDTIGEETARQVFLAFNRRFDPGHATVREAVRNGAVGTLEQLLIISRDPYPPPLDYIPHSGGLFRDMMIHDFDMARAILDEEPATVSAFGTCIVDEKIGELGDVDSATVTLVTASGKIAIIVNSRRSAFGFDQRVEAFGSEGMVMSDNPLRSGVRFFTEAHPGAPDRIREFFMERYGDSYRLEIESFLAHADGGDGMPVNAIDGLRAVYLAEAAAASNATGRSVQLTSLDQSFDHA